MSEISQRIRSRREELGLSQEELAKRMGYKSRSSINKIELGENDIPQSKIEAFAKALSTTPAYLMGWINDPSIRKISEIFPYHPTHRIPILGRISAGKPLFVEENIEGYTYTELNSGGTYYALRVAGDSMNAARINEGDLLIVRQQDEVENGQIAIVMVNGNDATVKKYYRNGDTVTLLPQSLNPEHQMQVYDLRKSQIKILGLVVQNVIKL